MRVLDALNRKNEIVEYKPLLFTAGSEGCELLGQTEIKNFSGHTKTFNILI